MTVEEVAVVLDLLLVEGYGRGHEVGPVEEAAGEADAEVAHLGEFGVDHLPVVFVPHARAARPGPEVDADPVHGSAVEVELA
ncbi:hypothetical protein [Pseudolysinimonas kribbensis]|uniref:hypothetical protein n=1 Tax=Pseudolysinimonas kribbensis TaxID=433641 RepID=UPI0024E0F0D5|nr:hypothetical protein [Pseudolysinimonas kribbensis]